MPAPRRTIDYKALGQAIFDKRNADHLSLDAASAVIGVDKSTLHRLENYTNKTGCAADVYVVVCVWLGVPTARFVEPSIIRDIPIPVGSPVSAVRKVLKNDASLTKMQQTTLGNMFASLYVLLCDPALREKSK